MIATSLLVQRNVLIINVAEGVGFARILLDLTVSFALLNRVIKHYQRVFGT